MAAYLVPLDAGQPLTPLEKTILLVGRQQDCDIVLTRSRKVSRRHCCIAQVDSQFVIRDLGSTNGVFVNKTRIQRETVIRLGDEVTIGDVRFRLEAQAPPREEQQSAPMSMEIPVAVADPGAGSARPKARRRSEGSGSGGQPVLSGSVR